MSRSADFARNPGLTFWSHSHDAVSALSLGLGCALRNRGIVRPRSRLSTLAVIEREHARHGSGSRNPVVSPSVFAVPVRSAVAASSRRAVHL